LIAWTFINFPLNENQGLFKINNGDAVAAFLLFSRTKAFPQFGSLAIVSHHFLDRIRPVPVDNGDLGGFIEEGLVEKGIQHAPGFLEAHSTQVAVEFCGRDGDRLHSDPARFHGFGFLGGQAGTL